jgi:hypothetical protein
MAKEELTKEERCKAIKEETISSLKNVDTLKWLLNEYIHSPMYDEFLRKYIPKYVIKDYDVDVDEYLYKFLVFLIQKRDELWEGLGTLINFKEGGI